MPQAIGNATHAQANAAAGVKPPFTDAECTPRQARHGTAPKPHPAAATSAAPPDVWPDWRKTPRPKFQQDYRVSRHRHSRAGPPAAIAASLNWLTRNGPRDPRHGPRCQQPAMDGAHELHPEQIGQVGRHGGEAAPVHRQDDPHRRHEQRKLPRMGQRRRRGIERHAQHEEGRISQLSPNAITERGPDKPAGNVEEREQAGEAGRDRPHPPGADPPPNPPKPTPG